MGDKANKMLAWLEKRDRERNWVLEIHSKEGGIYNTGTHIAEAFANYYETLYTPSST